MKSVSYDKMRTALSTDLSIMKDFLNLVNNNRIRDYLYSYPEFTEAYNKGEPYYSRFIKENDKFATIDRMLKNEAENQLMKLFMSNEFGEITEKDVDRLNALSSSTLTKINKNALEQAEYQIVDLPSNPSNGGGGGEPSNHPPHHRPRVVYNYLEDPVVSKYLNEVLDDDIQFEGVFATNIGTKVPGRRFVYYYVFSPTECSDYKIIEPIGQKNNRTFMLRTKLDFEDLCEQLSLKRKCLDDLARSGEVIRINHAGPDVETVNCPNRMKLIASVAEEIEKKRKNLETSEEVPNETGLVNEYRNHSAQKEEVSLEQLSAFVTKQISILDLDEVKKYIAKIYKGTVGIESISLPRLVKLATEVKDLKDFDASSGTPKAEVER